MYFNRKHNIFSDLSENITSTAKFLADDISLFYIVIDPDISTKDLNKDLKSISAKCLEWAYNWKMSLNPDKNKQTQQVAFWRKQFKLQHPQLLFNNVCSLQKPLNKLLDEKLDFKNHFKAKIQKAGIGTNVIKKMSSMLRRQPLLTIYKSFVRPHLDYGDIIYDQTNNESLCFTIESVQYKWALAIASAMMGTSQARLYKEVGTETLKFRRWWRRLTRIRHLAYTVPVKIYSRGKSFLQYLA